MDPIQNLIDDFSSSIQAKRLKDVIRELHDVRPGLLFGKPAIPHVGGLLSGTAIEDLFLPEPVKNKQSAQGVVSGLLIWNDSMEEAHTIAQNIPTAEGSYFHAIIHRREPDIWNSGYWFRRTGEHPIYPLVYDFVTANATESLRKNILAGPAWDPAHFNAYFESVMRDKSDKSGEVAAVQLAELLFLIAHTYRHTIGT
jgi:hypothetical protein